MAIKYNMEFYTHITIPKTPFTFSYTVQTVLLGSCSVSYTHLDVYKRQRVDAPGLDGAR